MGKEQKHQIKKDTGCAIVTLIAIILAAAWIMRTMT